MDGELCQAKYELPHDIANTLFGELGKCSIVGLDEKNKSIVSTGKIRVKHESGFLFNPELDNFELRWTIGDKEIRYRAGRTSKGRSFIYREKLKGYEREFSRIEKYC